MNIEDLVHEINAVFPDSEMPPRDEILCDINGPSMDDGLIIDIEEYREKPIDIDLIRIVHQELVRLSCKSWQWIIRDYLNYSITPEAKYNQMETEFLIYAFCPYDDFEEEVSRCLSGFNKNQIKCFLHFIEWCSSDEFWGDYCPEQIEQARAFLALKLEKLVEASRK